MGIDFAEVWRDYGLIGIVVLMVVQFVVTNTINQRARSALEVRTHERLNQKHDEIVALMNKQVTERDTKINSLMTAQEQALKQNKKTLEELEKARMRNDVMEVGERESARLVEELKQRLDVTKRELEASRIEADKIPPLLEEIVSLRARLNVIEAELALEKSLRDRAEKRVKNLEQANKKATTANKDLIERVNLLSTQNHLQSERIVILEKSLIEMANKPEVAHDENVVRGDDGAGGAVAVVGDAVASANDGTGHANGSRAGDGDSASATSADNA